LLLAWLFPFIVSFALVWAVITIAATFVVRAFRLIARAITVASGRK
jgi:uncharacterized membrane protein